MVRTMKIHEKTIQDYFGLMPFGGEVGVEVELESVKPWNSEFKSKFWQLTADNSLRRNGIELKTKVPVFVRKTDISGKPNYLKEVVSDFNRLLEKDNPIKHSPRTSVHVHVNVQDKTFNQVIKMIAGYILVENLLLDYCGPERVANCFCLKIKNAEDFLDLLKGIIKDPQILFNNPLMRYSALNLQSLQIFGSLEFRGMRGLTDPEELEQWVRDIFWMFQKIDSKYENIQQIMDTYHTSPRQFLVSIFRAPLAKDLISTKDWTSKMKMNFNHLIEVDLAQKFLANSPDVQPVMQRRKKVALNLNEARVYARAIRGFEDEF